MIVMSDVVGDLELAAPQPFQVLRSTGQWVLGGFSSSTTVIDLIGPVQRASDKEVAMLPEGDRVGGVMAFWCTTPIYTTRITAANQAASVQTPQGTLPGTVFTVSGGISSGVFTVNGLFQTPGIDYTLSNGVITTTYTVPSGSTLLFVGPVSGVVNDPSAADILVYPPNGDQYRVLAVRHYPGSGYWKALGTRMSAT